MHEGTPRLQSVDAAAHTSPAHTARKLSWLSLAVATLVIAGGLLLGNALGSADRGETGLGGTAKIVFLLGLIPVVALALATHEAGHVAAGRAVGFRLLLFVVGPLKVERLNDRFRIALNRNLAYYGGVTVVVPAWRGGDAAPEHSRPEAARPDMQAPADTRAVSERLRWVMAGGPLASLLTGALALVAYSALDLSSITSAHALSAYYARVACQLYAGLSIGLGIVTLLPNRLLGMPSDGARLLELSRTGATHERDVAVMLLGLLSAAGARPRAWDGTLVARAASIVDESLNGVLGQLLAYYYELDQGRPAAAEVHLQQVLQRAERTPALYRGTLFLEAAYYYAVQRRDAVAARSWLERAQKAPAEAQLRHRGAAAVLIAEGDFHAALRSIERAEQALSTSIEAGMVLAHRDELRALRQAAERAAAVAH